MLTKLRKIILEEDLTSAKIYDKANELFYPSIQLYQLSKITSGKHPTAYVATYIKILHALNSLTGKKYTLDDIVDESIVNDDLK